MALTKVSSSLVSDNAITTGKLVDGGVHSADIATNAITSTKIAQNSILTKHIDDGQVTTAQLGADAVTAAKIADDAISEEHLDVTVITGLTEVTAATGDLLMVADVSDSNNLKKIPVSSILAGTHTGAVNTSGTITVTGDISGSSQLKMSTSNWPTSTVGNSTGRHIFGGTAEPLVVLWNEAAPAAGNISSLFIGAKSATSATTFAGGWIRGGLENNSDSDGFLSLFTTYGGGSNAERMRIDSDGKVGIGTDNPSRGLTIDKSGGEAALNIIKNNTSNQVVFIGSGSSGAEDYGIVQLSDAGTVKAQIYTAGVSYFNGGNVGIGTDNPPYKLVVSNNGASGIEFGPGYSGTTNLVQHYNRATSSYVDVNTSALQHKFYNGTAFAAIIDSSGNVGIGVTPAAHSSLFTTLDIDNTALTAFNDVVGIWEANTYYDGSNYKYRANGYAGQALINNGGEFQVKQAVSGTAGANATLVQNFTVDNSGKVGIGETSPGALLEVNDGGNVGQIRLTRSGSTRVELSTNANEGELSLYRSSNAKNVYISSYYDSYFSGGNVGIGTTSPNEKLEVFGNIQFTTSVGTTSDRPAVTAATLANGEIRAKNADTGDGGFLRLSAGGGTNTAQVSYIDIQGYSNSTGIGPKSVIIGTQGTDRIVVDSVGNVGIGETEPTSRLHVTNATNIDMSGSAAGQLRIEGAGYSGAIALNADAMHIYQNSSGRSIVFGNNETEQVRIKYNGYVGIGTDSPLDLLHLETTSGDVRQLMNAPAGSDAEIKLAEAGTVVYTIGHDAASSEFRIGTTNVDTDVFLRGKSAGNISIGRGGQQDGLAGVQVLRGGLLINGGVNDMGATDSHYSNVWTWVGCSGVSGTFNGAVRVNIPDVTGAAGSVGYGGFSIEVYVAGYSGKYCHAFLSGYNNTGITLSENAIRASSGGWSTSYGMVGTQGFYFDINYPSGLIHPSIYIRVSKGGHTAAGKGTDFNDVNVNWT